MLLFVAVAWGVCTAVVTVMAVLLWVGSSKVNDRVQAAFETALTSDKEMARAMVRGFPVVCLASWGIALSGFAVALDGIQSISRPTGFPVLTMAMAGAALLFIGVLADILIIRLNRPMFLVPPHLRWEPGHREVERARASAAGAVTAETAVEALYSEHADRWAQKG